ncbi:TRAP transporter large permease subunit [uncultured Hydrogenophaga sp.]|uniref:TRAP transporter large permease n=1 Tax=uncultured Hydrogenophaga sp. TaxID=199683 RepID=UPI0025868ABA|nr:TRAP transporter large permease subunit [uncultured Hydrogenophaga sp.]
MSTPSAMNEQFPGSGADGSQNSAELRGAFHRHAIGTLEALAALLLVTDVALLLMAVIARYFFHTPIIWVDEAASLVFIWLSMFGAVLAMDRSEHLRLSLFVDRLTPKTAALVNTVALLVTAVVIVTILPAAWHYAVEEWLVTTPSLGIPGSVRASAIFAGSALMLLVVLLHLWERNQARTLLIAAGIVGGALSLMWLGQPWFHAIGNYSILLFLVGLLLACLAAGVPIAFCFGAATLAFLSFTTSVPMMVVVGRMDEGMSSLILLSVPIFFLLGCILDATGMGGAIVKFLAALVGHVRAGMSYVLLGSLFLVSGISGAKASDMATVAPALFPEMKKRGNKPSEMIALLATGAAMADTVPPSIVLIVMASVAGISVAALFSAGIAIAAILLLVLLVAARLRFAGENIDGARRPPLSTVARITLVAFPALVLPFLIRGLVTEGVATATEVSTLAVLYALIVGQLLYSKITLRRGYTILLETVRLTGAIMIILGTASAMAWALTQTGFAAQLGQAIKGIPGGWISFMLITIAVFLLLGSILEGIPAIVLMAPILYPSARALGINDVQYAMVIVVAMNIGLMAPPLGVGYYLACSIGKVAPNVALRAIWPYLGALIVGLLIIAMVPQLTLWFI